MRTGGAAYQSALGNYTEAWNELENLATLNLPSAHLTAYPPAPNNAKSRNVGFKTSFCGCFNIQPSRSLWLQYSEPT
jgi:hypothetical protein